MHIWNKGFWNIQLLKIIIISQDRYRYRLVSTHLYSRLLRFFTLFAAFTTLIHRGKILFVVKWHHDHVVMISTMLLATWGRSKQNFGLLESAGLKDFYFNYSSVNLTNLVTPPGLFCLCCSYIKIEFPKYW